MVTCFVQCAREEDILLAVSTSVEDFGERNRELLSAVTIYYILEGKPDCFKYLSDDKIISKVVSHNERFLVLLK